MNIDASSSVKVLIVVQARMTSTRLPGKVLLTAAGKPLFEHQLERLMRAGASHGLVVATTVNASDDPIVALCGRLKVPHFRGSEEDVLSRYFGAAQAHHAGAIVRVTADCPLIDPHVIDRVIRYYLDSAPRYDYVSNCFPRTYPRGMDTEVLSFDALRTAHLEATARPDREHVTPYVHMHPGRFRLGNVAYKEDHSRHRWTVDTPEDFELVRRILEALYERKPEFTLEDCLELLSRHPDWAAINAGVVQKKYGE